MPTFLEKGRIATVWQRLTANRWTVAFVVALLVQSIAQMLIQLEARGTNDFGVGILQGLQAAPAGLKGNRQEEFNAVSSANAQSVATSAASIGLAEAEEDESESSSSSSDEEGESSDSSDDEEDESSTAAPARSGAASPSGITPATSPTSETSAEDNPPFGRNARIPTPHPFNVIQSQSSVSPSNAFPQSNVVATSTSLAFAQSSVAALPITATAGRSHLLETSSAAATLGSGSDDVESEDSGDSSDDESESGSESETFRKRVRRVKVRRFKRSALRRRQADRLLSNRIDTRETALSASDSDSDVEAGTVGQADQTSLKDAAETAQASSDSDSESASSHNESESSSDSDYGTKATASQQTSQDIVTLGRRHRQSFKEGVIQLPFKEGVIAVQESPDFHLPPLETVQTTAQSLDLFALGPMPLAITQSDLSDETRRQSIAQNDLEPQEASSRPNLGDATPAFTLAPDTSPLRQRRMKRAQLPDGVSVSAGSDGTAQVFGLVDDSDKPIVVTEECAASLDRSLVIIERQGVQTVALALFDVWLMLLALFGLYQQSVPHLPAVWISKLAAVIFNVLQVVKIQAFHDTFHEDVIEGTCNDTPILPNYWGKVVDFSIAALVLEVAFLFVFSAFLFVLYRFIQWQSFRSIGADLQSARRNRIKAIQSILSLVATYFVLTFFALLLHEITENDRPSFWKEVIDREGVSGGYVGVVATATAFVPFWLGLGYLANLKHSLPLLSMFGLGCIALLGSAIFFLDRAPEATSALFTTWPFFVFISVMALLSFLGCTGSTVIYYIFDGRFRKRRSDMPPAKGFEWTPRAEGGLDRRPTIDQNSGVDVPEDPEPYEPEKDAIPVRQELVAPHRPFSNQYPEFPSSVTSSPLPQTIAESTMNEYRINQAPPPTATTRSSFYSECQEIEVPVSYKTSEVPILQRPKAPKNEISRWSATAASSAGGMTSAGSFGRTSWIGGDEARQIRQTYTKPSPVAEE